MKLCSRHPFISVIAFTVVFAISSTCSAINSRLNSQPTLHNIKFAREGKPVCSKSSPEIFFHHFAEPSLSVLYHRCKALFGILMDKIEASYSANEEQALKNETREQWEYIAKTVQSSLNTVVDRLESEWGYFILLHDIVPLPWEVAYKLPLIYESVGRLEYGYLMVEAVVRSGVKEIVGTLQFELMDVLIKLEEEVSQMKGKNGDEKDLNLLQQMKVALSKMKSTFTTKLLEKVVSKALDGYSSHNTQTISTFISESMEQMAIVLHAFREKGLIYVDFWHEMALVFPYEFKFSDKSDASELVSRFMQELAQNQDKLINLIVQIISREN